MRTLILCVLMLSSYSSMVTAARKEVYLEKQRAYAVKDSQVEELCAPTVIHAARGAFGIADGDTEVAPEHIAALLTMTVGETESMLVALGLHAVSVSVRTLCSAAVHGIATVLHEAAPRVRDTACTDAACEGPIVNVSINAMLQIMEQMEPHMHEGHADILTKPGNSTEARPPGVSVSESTRLLLHVAFGIFPAPDEVEDDDNFQEGDGVESSLSQVSADPTFGSRIRSDRHSAYQSHTQMAIAWTSWAANNMNLDKVVKWFGSDKRTEVRRMLNRALVAMDKLHLRKDAFHLCNKHNCAAYVWSYSNCNSDYVSMIMAGSTPTGCGEMENDRYQINFCESYWRSSSAYQTATILHEAMHHFGVKDHSYKYDEIRYQLSTDANLNNADTYAFFVADVNGNPDYRS